MAKKKHYPRCQNPECGDRFPTDHGSKYCSKECRDEAYQIQSVEKVERRRKSLEKFTKDGCMFNYLNKCNGNLNCHHEDGTYWKDITGKEHSSIFDLSEKKFSEALEKNIICLCSKHLTVVVSKEKDSWSWEEIMVHIMDESGAFNELTRMSAWSIFFSFFLILLTIIDQEWISFFKKLL